MNTANITSTTKFMGGVLLVAGSCIGAGMLGMPVLSALAGFKPSALMYFFCWLFMCTTGLLLLEVNLWFDRDISIISMVDKTLGRPGRAIAWGLYLFLFYSLMVSYVTGSGTLFSDFVFEITGTRLPYWFGSLVFIAMFGALVYIGTEAVDQFNRLLMLGLVISYVLLMVLGVPHVDRSLLNHKDWSSVGLVIPAMVVTFGFHNLIPSLTTYYERDSITLRRVFITGSLIALMVYLLWQWLILGIVPLNGSGGLFETLDKGDIATHALRKKVGGSWVVDVAEYFAFFAIVTSFLGVALSFVDFLADGLNVEKKGSSKVFLCCLVLLPPFVFALAYPKVFLIALGYAGGFGAVILFGILPALMVWKGRYHLFLKREQLVPGGKTVLAIVILVALLIVGLEFREELTRATKNKIEQQKTTKIDGT